jgi:hypothetical protein
LSHIEPLFDEFLPKVVDRTGEEMRVVPGPMNLGRVPIVSRKLEPGQTIRLGYAWFHIRPPGWKGPVLAYGEALRGAVAGLEDARVTLARALQRIQEGKGP